MRIRQSLCKELLYNLRDDSAISLSCQLLAGCAHYLSHLLHACGSHFSNNLLHLCLNLLLGKLFRQITLKYFHLCQFSISQVLTSCLCIG